MTFFEYLGECSRFWVSPLRRVICIICNMYLHWWICNCIVDMLNCINVVYCIGVDVYLYTMDTWNCIGVTNACSSIVNTCTYTLPVMCLIISLYHMWSTLRGRLALGSLLGLWARLH